MQIVKIPSARIEAIVGKGGKTKKLIERLGHVNLVVDDEGNVQITSKDPLAEWKTVDVVKAIGRGFSIESARKLFSDDCTLKIINLKEVFSKKKQRERYKARVIGTKGKAKRTLAEISGAEICIYGDTISALGTIEEVELAIEGIRMLLRGAPHSTTYFVLQKKKGELHQVR
jgi:ribosomal RNA assembly protein